jgi:hypothetical protein
MTESFPGQESGRPSPYSEPVLTAPGLSAEPTGNEPLPYGTSGAGGAGSGGEASAKDKAADAAQAGKQAAGEVASSAVDRAKDVAGEAQAQARNVVGEAQSQLREQAKAQHRNAVGTLRSLGDELSSMASNGDQSGQASALVGQAGERVHSVASWLDAREPGDLLGEARAYASRHPGTFVLGALAAGVLAGRLTRGVVAAHKDDSTDDSTSSSGATGGPASIDSGSTTPGGLA